ncbi:serine/threonine-protein kinase [Nocardia otitidiscaviarum]|uniref:serine/threonine-protein kinase n=1 Tax=Nocardia otitidiscaviarum TaxID=1823 RepID=UPI002B4B1DF2|nr:protein kinase [Nocardia otitidiscaviarum]
MQLGVNESFAGYEIEGVLGNGGMGTVYLARHPRLPRKVALKLLNREVSADQEVRRRFEREANVIARLDHPSIVGIHDRGVQDGHLWIAVQYVPGTDAARLDPRAVSVERAVRIITETAAALDYAHSHGILHRDVKPANILLWAAATGRDERAVLTDFGIAALADSNTQLTATGMFSATLAFASPEQLSGERLDHRGDQYSLACTCYALLTGHGPFPATNPGQVVAGHLNKPLPHLHPQRPDVPPALDEVLARAAAKSPDARYPDCSTFAAAARAALTTRSSAPLPRPPATTPNPNATRPGAGADTPTPDAAEPHPGTATSHPTRFGPGTAHSGTANGHLPAAPPGAAATAHPGSANGRPAAAPGAAANPGTAGGYPAAGAHPRAAAGPGIAAHRGAGTSAPDAAAHRHTAAAGPGWAADPGAAVGFPAPGTPAAAAMSRGAAADGPGVAVERGAAGIGPGAAGRPGSGEASPRGGGGAGGGAGAWAGGGKPSAATPRARQDDGVAGSRASGWRGPESAAGRAASGRRGPEGSGAGRRSTAAVTAAGLALVCSALALLCVVRLAAQIGGLRYIPDAFRDVGYPGYPYLAVGLGFAGVVAALLAGGALLLPLSRRIGRRWIVLGSLGFMAGAAGSQLYVHYVGRNIHALTMYYPLREPVAVAASGLGFLLAFVALVCALATRR